MSPYDGGIFHQAPLLLPLFSILPAAVQIGLASGILYTIIDLLNAYALGTIADSAESTSTRFYTSPRKDDRLSGDIISAAYLFNPFTVAACLGLSTSIFTNMAIIHSISSALDKQNFRSMFALAMASYLSMYPALLLPPLAILCWDRTIITGAVQKSAVASIQTLLTTFSATLATLFGASYITTGSWSFVSATYGFHLLVPDLTPNAGLWWYFFIEIFDSFRAFFLGVFWLHLASYVGGLTLRLRRQPLFVMTTLLGMFAILKPYPSISDVSLYLAFLPLYKHIFSRKYSYVYGRSETLTCSSHEIHFRRILCSLVRQPAWPSILLPMDIRRIRERKLLLRYHPCVEPWTGNVGGRFAVRCTARRV